MDIILDTNILIDIVLQSRPRHENAKRLGRLLMDKGYNVRVPAHAMFEIASAIKNEKMNNHPVTPMPFTEEYTSDEPFALQFVPIDDAFIGNYLDVNLPYIKGGDLIFLCMAKKDKAALVAEDNKLYNRAKEADVEVYRISEFLDKLEA